jgi:hypothetical protein
MSEMPLVYEVNTTIMAIRLQAFREVVAREDFKHAIKMMEIMKSDIARGALDTWLTNHEYMISVIDEIVSYCKENDAEKILTSVTILDYILNTAGKVE